MELPIFIGEKNLGNALCIICCNNHVKGKAIYYNKVENSKV